MYGIIRADLKRSVKFVGSERHDVTRILALIIKLLSPSLRGYKVHNVIVIFVSMICFCITKLTELASSKAVELGALYILSFTLACAVLIVSPSPNLNLMP